MLSAENLQVSRNGTVIFTGISFTLLPGSFLALSGANGVGKTTLLRTLAGLLQPEKGRILWEGNDIASNPDPYISMLHYAGHLDAIKPQLSVIDNIGFWAKLHGTPELVLAALSYFKLGLVADTPCHMLSAGWKKRVALARLMACYAELWLLDEPETYLDVEAKELLTTLIRSRISQGGVVITASHNPLPIPETITLSLADFKGTK